MGFPDSTGALIGAHVAVDVTPPPARGGSACRLAIAAIQSPTWPASARNPILRRIVLTSGPINPSTRPSATGSMRVAPSARASPSSARNTLSHNMVSRE